MLISSWFFFISGNMQSRGAADGGAGSNNFQQPAGMAKLGDGIFTSDEEDEYEDDFIPETP